MDVILRKASESLGVPLSEAVDLGGSSRSTVIRCRTGDGRNVVIKAYKPDAFRSFTAEAAGLALGAGSGPRLLAVDTEYPLLVMEDLGEAPSLADALLGESPETARAALLAWAIAYGRLAAETTGREDELAALRARYDRGEQQWGEDPELRAAAEALPGVLDALGVTTPPGLAAELAPIADLDKGPYPVYSPGDICPDNNLIFPDGMRLLDFEGAGFHSVFLDAVYTRMPFSTCWCVFRLPPAIQEEIESAYRSEVAKGHPDLLDDEVWRAGMRLGTIALTVQMTTLVPRVLTGDRPLHPTRRAPSMRQLLRHRWQALLADLPPGSAVAEAMRGLLAATEKWDCPALPPYPVFAG
ncbi:hypothetical protein [Nonomuraea sp. NPDC001699]